MLVNNAINPKISRAREPATDSPRDDISFQLYPFKGLCWTLFLLCAFRRRTSEGKLLTSSFAGDSRLNDAFFPPENKVRLTKKTHKKNLLRFVVDPFVKLDEDWKKNKYRGSLNLWTIYIFMCDFFLVGDLALFGPRFAWWFYWAGLCFFLFLLIASHRAIFFPPVVDFCNWFLTFFFTLFEVLKRFFEVMKKLNWKVQVELQFSSKLS